MAPPLISVVIPCYNAAPWIAESLRSIDRQGGTLSEVIVVDDGSTDGSLDIVRSQFPKVQTIRTENAGPSAARNAGTKIAQGSFIQYLDADDCLADGKWEQQLAAMESQKADIAYGDWQKRNEAGSLLTEKGSVVIRRLGARPELDLISNFWCPPAVYLFRRSIIDAIGGWRESLRLIEDVRLLIDAAMAGARFVYTPGIQALYRVHPSSPLMRDSRLFLTCCLFNDRALENELIQRGELDEPARTILVKNYFDIAQNSCVRFPELYETACSALNRLEPGFVPRRPALLKAMSKLVGYRRAEWIAFAGRQLKHLGGMNRYRV